MESGSGLHTFGKVVNCGMEYRVHQQLETLKWDGGPNDLFLRNEGFPSITLGIDLSTRPLKTHQFAVTLSVL